MTFIKDFAEASQLYRSLNREDQNHLINSLSDDLKEISDKVIQLKIVSYFYQSDQDFGIRMANQIGLSRNNLINS